MSHILSKIEIINFKSIQHEVFELAAFTPLVGYNNAGKSNMLEAINWFLRKSSLSQTSFNNPSVQVEITGVVSGIDNAILESLTSNHRNAITPYLSNSSLAIKRIQSAPSIPIAQLKFMVQDPQAIGTPTEWKTNPTGLDQALQSLFPEPIQIGAMENAEEDASKSKNTTTIGKLLTEITGPIQTNYLAQINSSLSGIKNLFDANGSSRASELNQFDADVNSKIESFFSGVTIKLHIPTPEIKELFAKGTIKVFENALPDGKDFSSLGHGAQRSIQMALIRHLADIRQLSAGSHSNTLLLIDEPELYLHPQAVEILRDALIRLSRQGYQVIFSTHSPFMITSRDVENTILVRKHISTGTYKRNSLRSAVAAVAATHPSQLGIIFSISNSSNILFAENVVLAEGKTENKILPKIIEKVSGHTHLYHKLAIVPVDGTGNTNKTMEVLRAMDIPTKSIVDLDYALREGERQGFLAAGDSDILAIKAHLQTIAPAHGIGLNGDWPSRQGSTMSASQAIALLAKESAISSNINSIKEKMLAKNVYVWKKGTIEAHLGGIEKNEQAWAQFNRRLDTENLSDILPHDHDEITSMINWIMS